ncbi:MAG: glucose-1-phosphate thymidylyltransferase RfbA [Melioribacteraceae bacterium]|nr:glucose-1-phosphate thymidylyltransferase RfbA [Melioribacteraceae bacterium]
MKGIVLAGRRWKPVFIQPQKFTVNNSRLIYDKPLIYYPISILMLGGIREILIISDEKTIPLYKQLFGTGEELGLTFSYKVQDAPNGIAEAFILGEDFIGDDNVTLILGDNIFYGKLNFLYNALENHDKGGTIFAYRVTDPQRYGIVEFDKNGKAISIEEKPQKPKSNFAVPGLYVYDNEVVEISKNLVPSARGELEITDVNKKYLENRKLKVEQIGRGVAWLDTGTPEALLQAANFFGVIEDRQGLKVACLEEISYLKKFIDKDQLNTLVDSMPNSLYKDYLVKFLEEID